MEKIRLSGELEKHLNQFTETQKNQIYHDLVAIQITEGCSTACPDCGLGALPGVRDYIRPKTLIDIFKSIPEKRTPNLLYFASEPFDYNFEGEDYESIHAQFREITKNNPDVITSIPKGQEERIFNLLVEEVEDVTFATRYLPFVSTKPLEKKLIDAISITPYNYPRLEKKFNSLDYMKNYKQGPFFNTLELPGRKPLKTMDNIDFWQFLKMLENRHPTIVRNFVTDIPRYKIGQKNIDNLENKRIADYQGTLITPKGAFNIRPTNVTKDNPIGQVKTPIRKECFFTLPYGKVKLI